MPHSLWEKSEDKEKNNEHVEIGKQSPLKQEWKWFLKSSSLFVRIIKKVFAFAVEIANFIRGA